MTRRIAAGSMSVLLVLGGCADYVGEDVRSGEVTALPGPTGDVASATTSTTTPPDPADPRTLDVGTCFDDVATTGGDDDPTTSSAAPEALPTEGAFARGEPVLPRSCGEAHRYELYARQDLGAPDGPWPGEDVVAEEADRICTTTFEEFVGIPWAESTLDYAALHPSEQSWGAGDRAVSCALFDLGLAPLEGSMGGRER